MRQLFGRKNYENMSRDELVAEGRRRRLDPHLLSFKGVEGAWEQDRIAIIRQLNELDRQKKSWHQEWWGKLLLGVIVGIIVFLLTLLIQRLRGV